MRTDTIPLRNEERESARTRPECAHLWHEAATADFCRRPQLVQKAVEAAAAPALLLVVVAVVVIVVSLCRLLFPLGKDKMREMRSTSSQFFPLVSSGLCSASPAACSFMQSLTKAQTGDVICLPAHRRSRRRKSGQEKGENNACKHASLLLFLTLLSSRYKNGTTTVQ